MNSKSKQFHSNGKLLLTGEYVVLDGAEALAIPTKYGQQLIVESNDTNIINWTSYNELNEVWFQDNFLFSQSSKVLTSSNRHGDSVSERLIQILKVAHDLNPNFLNGSKGYTIKTYQDFNRLWGLGTSSTLINNVSDWAKIDAYELLKHTFGGSGYDIACAQNKKPIRYQLTKSGGPIITTVAFDPMFKSQLYFVYLNEKQNSRAGIATYKNKAKLSTKVITEINAITASMITCTSLSDFENLIMRHEDIISHLIEEIPIKTRLFKDFEGSIKSLGAWGGDFVLATSKENPAHYFRSKGFETVIPYSKMVLA